MRKKYKNKKGFTILEITVVLGIISIGLLGLSSLVLQTIQVEYVNRNKLIASMLAQESLELVRNIRDTNWKTGTNWDDSIYNSSDFNYTIDYDDPSPDYSANSIDDSQAKLFINNNGFYNHNGGTPTIFSRLITINKDADGFLDVKCQVQWKDRARVNNYTAETLLYNWQ
jgi:prepilin-type N-terminal cleavage/methylation domain-containing protein